MLVFDTNDARAGRVDLIAMATPDKRELVLGSLVLATGELSFQFSTTKLETTIAITGGAETYAGATGSRSSRNPAIAPRSRHTHVTERDDGSA